MAASNSNDELYAEELPESGMASESLSCLGSAGTAGTAGGCFGTLGTFGCYGGEEEVVAPVDS